jgi:hypothetical protein
MLFNIPLAVWILEGFMSGVPKELDETAYVDGKLRRRQRFKFSSRSPNGWCAERARRKLSFPNDRRKSIWF